MASQADLPRSGYIPRLNNLRAYTVCFFDPGQLVPQVKLVDAVSDEEAIEEARTMSPWMRREIWDRHRLVATIRSRAMA